MSVKATQLRMDIIMHFLCYNLQYVVPKCKRHAIVSKDCKRRWLLQVRRTFLLAASILSRGYFIGMQMMMLTQSFCFKAPRGEISSSSSSCFSASQHNDLNLILGPP